METGSLNDATGWAEFTTFEGGQSSFPDDKVCIDDGRRHADEKNPAQGLADCLFQPAAFSTAQFQINRPQMLDKTKNLLSICFESSECSLESDETFHGCPVIPAAGGSAR